MVRTDLGRAHEHVARQVQLRGWEGAGAGHLLLVLSPKEGIASLGCKHHLQHLSQLRKQEAQGGVTEKRRVEADGIKGL